MTASMTETEPQPEDRAGDERDPDDYGRTGEPDERATEGHPYAKLTRLIVLVGLTVLLGVNRGVSVLIVIAAVLVMIFFHELGHFVMARRAGMKVTEFMIGFGPRIFSFRRGEVEYGMKAIPLGAYVKIIGMANIEEVPPADEPRTYRQKTYLQRIGVAVAGSTMHFVMALLLAFAAFSVFGQQGSPYWSVGQVSPDSAAAGAGVTVGDRLVSLGGVKLKSFSDMAEQARTQPGEQVDLVVERGGRSLTLPATITSRLLVWGTVDENLDFYQGPDGRVRLNVGERGVVVDAGFQDADVVTELAGAEVTDIVQLRREVRTLDSGMLALTIERDGRSKEISLDLGRSVEAGEIRGFLGVGAEPEPSPISEAATGTLSFFGDVATQSTAGLARFFQPSNLLAFADRATSTAPGDRDQPTAPRSEREAAQATAAREQNRMTSIVGAVLLGEQLQDDWGSFLLFLASLNIVIGIFNLVPLPPFDGGHVAIATYEKIRELGRRDGKRYFADANKLLPVVYGVVMVLLVVGLMAIYLDLADPVKL